ncbi:MAG TPA: C40 family peptidase [Pyrinomonadaceae bacterium]|nr:C40 family peptidase [Pyrinomonadaceae bacterium]
MNFKKLFLLSVCAAVAVGISTASTAAQGRDRVVKPTSSQPTNLPPYGPSAAPVQRTTSSRPTLSSPIILVKPQPAAPLVKKTASSRAVNNYTSALTAGRTAYSASVSDMIYQGVMSRWGIPYRYGSTGPNTYDCSGFVWSVFNDAGINFTRVSARSLWSQSEPVYGDDRFKFGTLVFLNGLGHMGIVADENGFFHASSSKGITYSPFKGYWENRIVGFRRLPVEATSAADIH